MPQEITEQRVAVEAKVTDAKKGLLEIELINPGWGSSGYYSAEVLEAASGTVFPKGTHMYFDHPTESDRYERPGRSVLDLAAVLKEDATWDGHGLKARAQVFAPYRELLTDEDFTKAIGVSIIATAEAEAGEAEGRKGTIVTALLEGRSVDFVTHAGRGGAVLSVLESARGVEETTSNELRDTLTNAVRKAHGASDTYAWVQDFDDEEGTVWFSVSDETSHHLYQQSYTLDGDGQAVLDGEPTEVRAKTVYVPMSQTAREGGDSVPAPAGREENNMGSIQVDEAEHSRLVEDAGRVPELTEQLAESNRQRDEAREELAAERRTARAAVVIDDVAKEHGITFGKAARKGLLTGLPLKEGALDEDALKTEAEEAAAEEAERLGAGTVTGFGRTTGSTGVISMEAFEAEMAGKTQED